MRDESAPPVVVFTSSSDIEASVVMALLESQGLRSFRTSGNAHAIWPMAVGALGAIRVAVPASDADEALRVIESHRADTGSRVVRLSDRFASLEARIGYCFRDQGLLEQALTHRSRAAEDLSGEGADNESLEFLGDAVLGLVVATALYHQYPHHDEGQKSKTKAAVVSTQALARQAMRLGLGDDMLLGRGEDKTGGREKPALLADVFEALVAAMYLDGGLEAVSVFLTRELASAIVDGSDPLVVHDHKSALQERLQAAGRPLPDYRVAGETGPDHQKLFIVEVVVDGEVLGSATGRAKKEAEQEAARHALRALAP